MKARVLIPFIDKETRKTHRKNDIINVTEHRFNEICRKGRFIEPVVEEIAAEAE